MNLSDTKKRIDMNEYSFQEYARYFFQFHEKILCIETIKETIEVKIQKHMTEYMQKMSKAHKDLDPEIELLFMNIIQLLKPIGKSIFRYSSGKVFSPNLFDGIMISLAKFYDFYSKNPDKICIKIQELKEDDNFKEFSGSSTYSKTRIKKSMERALEIFGDGIDE